jgi:hypothetical protein
MVECLKKTAIPAVGSHCRGTLFCGVRKFWWIHLNGTIDVNFWTQRVCPYENLLRIKWVQLTSRAQLFPQNPTHVGNRWCVWASEDPHERNLCTSLSEMNKFTLVKCLPRYRISCNLIGSLKCNRSRPAIHTFCLAGSEWTSFITSVSCLDDEIVLKNGSWRVELFIWKGLFRDVWHRTYCT